ncbi:MAG: bifunctional 2-C-methyl-D-erythritol 4-phosphate cytidylyltransferase/2-C-methyl-D-erythritol 2,4-cyclodiphosphate synthase [Rhodospirillales bacterium]
MSPVIALIVAAGRGRRFGAGLPKQYRDLGGRPLLARTLRAFARHPGVDLVRTVIHPDDRELYDTAAAGLDLPDPVHGGAERQDSVRLGLESLLAETAGGQAAVLIHDGARPFPKAEAIAAVIAALTEHQAALPCLPVTDTLKRAEGQRILATVPRADLYRAQTPQGFRFTEILQAHRSLAGQALTDDAAVAEVAGLDIVLVPGDPDNVKITTEADLRAAAIRVSGQREVTMETRLGNGYDVHRLVPGEGLWLCGHFIAHDRGLAGHSDADVGLHALVDAILGAQAEGDIGQHFPPSDPQWRGAASHRFLSHACDLLAAKGGRIVNLDVTLVCERPKIGPHREAMRDRLAEIAGVAPARISVKATTSEKLGFTGRGEGIAALATACLELPAPDQDV